MWAVQLALCAFLVLFFFATLATYWPHIEAQGIDNFAFAYFIDTLLIQAFACEFREILSVVVFNLLMRELLLLFCCLRCSADFRGEGEDASLTKLARARAQGWRAGWRGLVDAHLRDGEVDLRRGGPARRRCDLFALGAHAARGGGRPRRRRVAAAPAADLAPRPRVLGESAACTPPPRPGDAVVGATAAPTA